MDDHYGSSHRQRDPRYALDRRERDPHHATDPRGQTFYHTNSSSPGRNPVPTARSGFLRSPPNVPVYTPTAPLGSNYISGPSSGSYMTAPLYSHSTGPSVISNFHSIPAMMSNFSTGPAVGSHYSSGPPMVSSYSSVPSMASNYPPGLSFNNIAPSQYTAAIPVRRDSLNLCPENTKIIVRQQPKDTLVTIPEKVRMRKTIDPPPCVELVVSGACGAHQGYIQNPNLFCQVNLLKHDVEEFAESYTTALMGTTVSSCHRLKDLNNKEGAWFVFSDISVKVLGKFRLQFTLYEAHYDRELQSGASYGQILCKTNSEPFEVLAAKDFRGLTESTMLTRSFSEQGIRLRIRKEPKSTAGKRRRSESQGAHTNPTILPANEYSPAKRLKHEYYSEDMPHSSAYQPTIYAAPQTPNRGLDQMGSRGYGSNESFVGHASSTSMNYSPPAPLDMYNNPAVAYSNQLSPLTASYAGYNGPPIAPQYNTRGASLPSLEDPAYVPQHFGEPDGQFQL